jgi:hypothetical protein
MSFRRTSGIVTDSDLSDPRKEADVIMTAAALGFAASYVANGTPIRFDINPEDGAEGFTGLQAVVGKIEKAVVDYLKRNNLKNQELTQYTGRGAYTGFVDNRNTEGNTDPVGPRPTARFLTADPDIVPADDPTTGGLHARWLPRTERFLDLQVAEGDQRLVCSPGNDWRRYGWKRARLKDGQRHPCDNLADQITGEMSARDKMVFNGDPIPTL